MTGIAHLARLWRFLAPYRWRIAGALAALVVAASCVLALGQGLRHVIDAGFGSGDPHLLNAALAAVVADVSAHIDESLHEIDRRQQPQTPKNAMIALWRAVHRSATPPKQRGERRPGRGSELRYAGANCRHDYRTVSDRCNSP